MYVDVQWRRAQRACESVPSVVWWILFQCFLVWLGSFFLTPLCACNVCALSAPACMFIRVCVGV